MCKFNFLLRAVRRSTTTHSATFALVAMVLGGCSTHPITGRGQIVVLPGVQAAYSDIGFEFSARSRGFVIPPSCESGCGSDAARLAFAQRVEEIGERLAGAANALSPELRDRIGKFQIEVSDGSGMQMASSAGGRIIVGSGLAALGGAGADAAPRRRIILGTELGALDPGGVVLAFLLAREMGHVIARHSEEDSGASMVVSALGLLLPGVNVLARFVVSNVASDSLRAGWAEQQQREADELALALLERTGLSALNVSFALQDTIYPVRNPEDAWDANYLASTQRVGQLAVASLRYSGLEGPPESPGSGFACRGGTRAAPCPGPVHLGYAQVPRGG